MSEANRTQTRRRGQAHHNYIHGLSGSPEYRLWNGMKQRCHSPHARHYAYYGGRGIAVCQEWRDSFLAFYQHVGPRPTDKHQLDRIDNDGDYEPGNVRWVLPAKQQRNRRSTHLLTYDGVTLCVTDWAERVGMSRAALDFRLRAGWTLEQALTTPMQPGKRPQA